MNELNLKDCKSLLDIINAINVKGSEVEYIATLKMKLIYKIKDLEKEEVKHLFNLSETEG